MPLSVREQCLSAFFDLFAGLTAYPLKKRMPNWIISTSELPALVQIDGGTDPLGGDDVSSGFGGTMRIAIRVTILAGLRAQSTDDLGERLSEARADIMLAGANKVLLAGNAWTQWTGDDDPIQLVEQGAPPAAVYPIAFTIHTTQAEGDPFSF